MTQAHTSFKKMRLLEPGMWDGYLDGCLGFSPDKMIIYHWSAMGDKPVESFTALATFRAYYTGNLLSYAAVIILLGAMGSAVQGFGVALLSIIKLGVSRSENPGAYEILCSNAAVFLLAVAAVSAVVRSLQRKP